MLKFKTRKIPPEAYYIRAMFTCTVRKPNTKSSKLGKQAVPSEEI